MKHSSLFKTISYYNSKLSGGSSRSESFEDVGKESGYNFATFGDSILNSNQRAEELIKKLRQVFINESDLGTSSVSMFSDKFV